MSDFEKRNIERRRSYLFSGVGVLLVGGILILANVIVGFVPVRLDTSEGGIYSISSGTKKLLSQLDDTLLVKLVFSPNLPPPYNLNEKYIRDILREYKRASGGKVRVEYVDPSGSESARRKASAEGVYPLQIDAIERGKREQREAFMGLSLYYGGKKEVIPFIQNTTTLEFEISKTIKNLIDPTKAKVAFLDAGASLTMDSEPISYLKDGIGGIYDVATVDLAKDQISDDIEMAWLIGSTESLSDEELNKIRSYVQGGGRLGILDDARTVDMSSFYGRKTESNLNRLFEEWGIEHSDGLVVDPSADRIQIQSTRGQMRMINIISYPYFPLVMDIDRSNPAVKNISAFSMPFVSPFIIKEEKPDITYTVLAKSSENSWLDARGFNLSPFNQVEVPGGSEKGPFNLILYLEGKFPGQVSEEPGRVVLFGTSRFIRSDFPPKQENMALFLNIMDWMAQDDILLSIRSKGASLKPLKPFSDGMRAFLKYLLMGFLPVLSILIGVGVWRVQKTRRAMKPLEYRDA